MNTTPKKVDDWALEQLPEYHLKEQLVFFGQLGFYDPARLKEMFIQFNPEAIVDERLRAFILAGKAKVYSLEGNLVATKQLLDEAMNIAARNNTTLDNPSEDEVLAYVHYEVGLYCRLVQEYGVALNHFILAKKYAMSPTLNLFAQYQIECIKVDYFGQKSKHLQDLVKQLKPYTMQYILALHRLGHVAIKEEKYARAKKLFAEALRLAEKGQYHYLIWMVNNSIGYFYIMQGKHEEAEYQLKAVLESVESYYLKAYIHENLAYLRFKQEDYVNAVEFCLQALDISLEHNVISQIPEEYRFVGEVYNRYLHQPLKARHYYQHGYEAAIDQVSQGLSLTGSRLRVVEEYVELLQRFVPAAAPAPTLESVFAYAEGKTWVQIRDIFHYNVIILQRQWAPSREAFFHRLQMKQTTFYSMQAKLIKRGFKFPDYRNPHPGIPEGQIVESLRGYIYSHKDLTWKELNQTFSRDLFRYLYRKYGYNKTVLGQVLNLSYPMIIERTKHLQEPDPSYESSVRLHA
jgi:tetratricopeptide (TPR) repeat protein